MNVLLVTGGAGFIGSNFIKYFLKAHKNFLIVNYDKLTYAGNLDSLKEISNNPRYVFVKGDICDYAKFNKTLIKYKPNYVINFAAESHVDNSINGPLIFGQTNVIGTLNLLQCVKEFWKKEDYKNNRFIQISTDEVFGSIDNYEDLFNENSNLLPNSPYSASKAGADLIARSFSQTYGLPIITTRCCNNYGAYQYKEKFIPTCISNALNDKPIPIYGDGSNIREWIHVLDHCAAIDKLLFHGKPGETYNIGSGEEVSNIVMAGIILNSLGKPKDSIIKVDDRLGHDKRYAIDSSKIQKELNWSCKYELSSGLVKTIQWYKKNQWWWDN